VALQAALLENESSAQPSLVSCFLCSHGDIASVPRASLSGTHATASPVPGPSPGTSVGCRPRRLLPTSRSRVADSRQLCPSGRPQEEEKPGPPARAEERKPRGCATRRSGARARARQSPAGAMRERGCGGWWWRTSRRCHWRTYAARKRTELAELAGDPARLPADEGEKEEEVLHRHCGEELVLVCGGQRKAERDGGGDLRNTKSRRGGNL
jgi:hypothetical protein